MLNVALPVFEVISVVLAIFPIPSHWRAKNISMLMLVFWLILGNLNNFINRVIWIKDADNKAPGWCDICKLKSIKHVLITSCQDNEHGNHGYPLRRIVHLDQTVQNCVNAIQTKDFDRKT